MARFVSLTRLLFLGLHQLTDVVVLEVGISFFDFWVMMLAIKDESIWGPRNLCSFWRNCKFLSWFHHQSSWSLLWWLWYRIVGRNRDGGTWKRRSTHETKSAYWLVHKANNRGTDECTVTICKLICREGLFFAFTWVETWSSQHFPCRSCLAHWLEEELRYL